VNTPLPVYTARGDELAMGASLGNSELWVTTKGTGAIERIFHAATGHSVFGAVSIRYGFGSEALQLFATTPSDTVEEGVTSIPLTPEDAGTVELHPAYQRREFVLAENVRVRETTFVPLSGAMHPSGDLPVAYQVVELENRGRAAHALRVVGFARLRGTLPADVVVRFDPQVRTLVARNASVPHATRCFGVVGVEAKFASTSDFGRVYDRTHLHTLGNDTSPSGDVLGALQVDVLLHPGETASFSFACAAFDLDADDAIAVYAALPSPERALDATIRHLEDVLRVGAVVTPDRHINDGALWSKVNMRRVMSRYPSGRAFTNEPGVSSNVVGRDAAWFVYGNDHFLPAFSRVLLETFSKRQYDSGKIPEYYNALDGTVEDDGLNINDDTPLFVLAVNHHFRATGDIDWLRSIYPSVARAARYILSQVDERGLVYCNARDPRGNVWAIASWRNVIPGYAINGAVTEINAECVAALRAAAHLAENLGGQESDVAAFAAASAAVQRAMDEHLRNPDNGLYYLNVDVDGVAHTDVTGDQIFPVMFRACDEDTGFRIVSRLNAPDFWTKAGLRTASRHDPLYDPSGNLGLLGGVWPGLTWWYAFAAARYHPEFMVDALSASFAHYAADPKTNNTVPGQFGEYFDGESLINRGMRLSPWEPPRFLWAAVEGVCGLMLTTGMPRVNPLVPSHWKWLGVRRLPYHGTEITYFATRRSGAFHIATTADVDTGLSKDLYERDVSAEVRVFSDNAAIVALARRNEIVLLVGNCGADTTTVPVDLSRLVASGGTYDVCVFDSERDAWQPPVTRPSDGIATVAVSIEKGGFRLIEMKRRPEAST